MGTHDRRCHQPATGPNDPTVSKLPPARQRDRRRRTYSSPVTVPALDVESRAGHGDIARRADTSRCRRNARGPVLAAAGVDPHRRSVRRASLASNLPDRSILRSGELSAFARFRGCCSRWRGGVGAGRRRAHHRLRGAAQVGDLRLAVYRRLCLPQGGITPSGGRCCGRWSGRVDVGVGVEAVGVGDGRAPTRGRVREIGLGWHVVVVEQRRRDQHVGGREVAGNRNVP
jgi:hypothetical protein